MKKVLCFGDSNTFGYIPDNSKRYNEDERWSGILKNLLKDRFEVIEEGCNNRTAFSLNPAGIKETGNKIIFEILKQNFDIIIFSLGINDTQFIYNTSLKDFEIEIKKLINIIKNKNQNSKIILVCPNVIGKEILKSHFSVLFDESSIEKSKHLSKIYSKIADEKDCIFLDLNTFVKPSKIDGLHFEKEEHKKIAFKLKELIENLN